MASVTCGLTAEDRDQLWNRTLVSNIGLPYLYVLNYCSVGLCVRVLLMTPRATFVYWHGRWSRQIRWGRDPRYWDQSSRSGRTCWTICPEFVWRNTRSVRPTPITRRFWSGDRVTATRRWSFRQCRPPSTWTGTWPRPGTTTPSWDVNCMPTPATPPPSLRSHTANTCHSLQSFVFDWEINGLREKQIDLLLSFFRCLFMHLPLFFGSFRRICSALFLSNPFYFFPAICTDILLVLWHCWLGERKCIRPPKISHQQSAKVSLWDRPTFGGPSPIWKDLRKIDG